MASGGEGATQVLLMLFQRGHEVYTRVSFRFFVIAQSFSFSTPSIVFSQHFR